MNPANGKLPMAAVPNGTHKIYLESLWTLHGLQNQMIAFPPAGYEFVLAGEAQQRFFKALARRDKARALLILLDSVIPTAFAKSWVQKRKRPMSETALTYAVDHLVFRPEPWVVEVEYASALVGIHPKHLKRFRSVIEKTLASNFCKKILLWSEAGMRSVVGDLDARGFGHKCEIVYLAVPPKQFAKEHKEDKIRLLFVGSGSSEGAFEWRGSGLFESFSILRQQYSNLELSVRSDVPDYLRARYGALANLRILDEFLPPEQLEREYLSADIFVFPSYTTAPLTLLEAMSYELPTVTLDAWANSEYVENGKTGFVVPRSPKVPYYYPETFQPNFPSPEFTDALRTPDPNVVAELVRKLKLLIEDHELRRRLGRTARVEVEKGKFSLAAMNTKLKRTFDEIVASRGQAS